MLSVAIIGAGAISIDHLEALVLMDELKAVAIADIHEERAARAAASYGLRAYADYREMLEKEKPDIAVITLPHFLHKEAALSCAEHGCHIMLEKPMGLNVEECDLMIAAARRHGVKLMVGHTQHYFAENIQAKHILQSGGIGQLVTINDARHVDYYQPDRPEWFFHKAQSGGGIFMNLGSHSVDKIQWLTDSVFTQVNAALSFHGDKGDIEGSGVAFLRTSGGIPCTISQSGYGGVNRNETEIIGTRGMIRLATGNGLWISEDGSYRQLDAPQTDPPFVLQYRELLFSIQHDQEPACSGEYGRSVIKIVQALYESDRTGGEIRPA